eukprot:CAMPEP_0197441490 /NCGR_PEP_ID=MMETSP1175-20131217/7746_1 /TAXON_ID=1003142 /ORGANISM="Triceratium dubium, Strain CCMP147" /LENGTH=1129 /DNA_ID=CAMNT_0042971775 /DNA_START=147 /DNA_END=3536 /DNA_ORIENTATION=+
MTFFDANDGSKERGENLHNITRSTLCPSEATTDEVDDHRSELAHAADDEQTADVIDARAKTREDSTKRRLPETVPPSVPRPWNMARALNGGGRVGKGGLIPKKKKVSPSDPRLPASQAAPDWVTQKRNAGHGSSRRWSRGERATGSATTATTANVAAIGKIGKRGGAIGKIGKGGGVETVPATEPGSRLSASRDGAFQEHEMGIRPETVPPIDPPDMPERSNFGAGRTAMPPSPIWDLPAPAATGATHSSSSSTVAVSDRPGAIAVPGDGTDAAVEAPTSSETPDEESAVDRNQDAFSAFVVSERGVNRRDSPVAVAAPRTPPETETEPVYDGVAVPDRSGDAAEKKVRERRRKQRRILMCFGATVLVAAIGGGCYAAVVKARPMDEIGEADISNGEVLHDASVFPSSYVPSVFPSSPMPSMFPSSQISPVSPSSSPTFDRMERIRAVLLSHMDGMSPSSRTALDDAESPQGQALNWLVEQDERRVDPVNEKTIVQRYVLALLFFSTSGPKSWKDKLNFLSSQHECEWNIRNRTEGYTICTNDYKGDYDCHEFAYVGAGCEKDEETVKVLAIPKNRLKGTLPEELCLLSDLEQMYFLVNDLRGTIPGCILSFSSLELLYLHGNDLSGRLPEIVLEKNVSLRKVDLSWNRYLNGTLPSTWGQLSSLTYLALYHNQISGSIPSSWGHMKSLEELGLQSNRIIGSIPFEVCGLRSSKGGNLSRIWVDEGEVSIGCTASCDVCGGRGGEDRVREQDLSLSFLPHIAEYGGIYSGRTCGSFFFPYFSSSEGVDKGVDLFISRLADEDYAADYFGVPEPLEVSCRLAQNLGVYCGCTCAEPACSVCGAEGGTLANPQTEIDGTLLENVTGGIDYGGDVFEGFKPNCDFYEYEFLPNMVEGSEECEAYRADTIGVCHCQRGGRGGDRAWGRPFIKNGGCKRGSFLHEVVFVDRKDDGIATPGSNFGADLPSPLGLAVTIKNAERELLRVPFDQKKLNPLKSNERIDDEQQYVCLRQKMCYSVEIVAEAEGASVPVVAKTSDLQHAVGWEVRRVLTGSTIEMAGRYGETLARGSLFRMSEEEGTGGGNASEGCDFALPPKKKKRARKRKRKTAKPVCEKRTCEVPAQDNIFDLSIAN